MDNKQRILKGLEYFDGLVPSDFLLANNIHPSRWRELRSFFKLVTDYVNGEEEKKEQLDDDTIEEILNR